MNRIRWVRNLNWQTNPKPEIGDMAILHGSDAFAYHVRIMISSVTHAEIVGRVDAVFADDGSFISESKVNVIVGHECRFGREFVHSLVKRDGMSC